MTRKEILDAARVCVCGEREQDYGSPENNFATIAGLWTEYLGAKLGDVWTITSADVAAMMALLKIGRIAGGSKNPDNWIDLAGYAACGGEIMDGEIMDGEQPKEACAHMDAETLELGDGGVTRRCTRCGMILKETWRDRYADQA